MSDLFREICVQLYGDGAQQLVTNALYRFMTLSRVVERILAGGMPSRYGIVPDTTIYLFTAGPPPCFLWMGISMTWNN
jgi:hypothetical protein